MAHILWTSDLETGLQDIDEQKQQIFNQINSLHSAYDSQDPFAINVALFDLISSTMNHFAYEEEMLAEAQYHLIEPHKRVHQNFMDKLVEFQMKTMENPNELAELLPILNEWWLRHIRLNDNGYVDFVMKSGIYQKNQDDKWVRVSGADQAQFSNVAFDGWENQTLESETPTTEMLPETPQVIENIQYTERTDDAIASAENATPEPETPEPILHTEMDTAALVNGTPAESEKTETTQNDDDENFVSRHKPISLSSAGTSQWARLVDAHDQRQREISRAIKQSDDNENAPRGWAGHY